MSNLFFKTNLTTLYCGDARHMTEIPDNSIHMVVTSPPYYHLRKYADIPDSIWDGDKLCQHEWGKELKTHKGHPGTRSNLVGTQVSMHSKEANSNGQYCQKCSAWRGQLGSEPNPELYISHLVTIFQEVKRVLRSDGTCWINIGDSMASGKGTCYNPGGNEDTFEGVKNKKAEGVYPLDRGNISTLRESGLKPLDRVGIPERLVLALQADSWYWRSTIIWHKCLSGNTSIYAKSNGVPVRTSVRELYRLHKNKLQLPDSHGDWCNITGIERIGKRKVMRIILRDGYWITCSPEHRFSIDGKFWEARELTKGQILDKGKISFENRTSKITWYEHGYFIGWFLAEGNYEKEGIRFSLSAEERDIAVKLGEFARSQFDSDYSIYDIGENSIALTIFNKTIFGFVKEYLDDKGAKRKHLARKVWNTNRAFIEGIIDGWLGGDGHYEEENNRYRIGFTYNKELADDIQTACTMLGYSYRHNLVWVKDQTGKRFLCYRGEIRKERSNHPNNKSGHEIREIGFLPADQDVYEISVDSPDHLFTLPDSTLTHNSNTMPESVAGYRWIQHKVKECPQCKALNSFKNQICQKCGYDNKNNRGTERSRNTTDGRPQQDHDGKDFKPSVNWVDCPGCPKCLPNDGLILKRDNWRPTRNFEYIYQLAKAVPYYSDGEAVRTDYKFNRWGGEKYNGALKESPNKEDAGLDRERSVYPSTGANLRSVWTFPSQSCGYEHYAAYPPELPLRCIKAGSSEYGVCGECGAPYARIIEQGKLISIDGTRDDYRPKKMTNDPLVKGRSEGWTPNHFVEQSTVGWKATCKCKSDKVIPAIVLDPFAGTGTTLEVATKLGRRSVGYEISPTYSEMIRDRCKQLGLSLI